MKSNEDLQSDVQKVTLKGTLDSWYQIDKAGRIAWNTPRVWIIENILVVKFD